MDPAPKALRILVTSFGDARASLSSCATARGHRASRWMPRGRRPPAASLRAGPPARRPAVTRVHGARASRTFGSGRDGYRSPGGAPVLRVCDFSHNRCEKCRRVADRMESASARWPAIDKPPPRATGCEAVRVGGGLSDTDGPACANERSPARTEAEKAGKAASGRKKKEAVM